VASPKIYQTQFLLGAKVQASVGNSFGKINKGLHGMEVQAKQSARACGGISGAMKGLFKIAAGYVSLSAVWNFAKEGLKLASDLNEVQNVVSTTFKESTYQINAWSKSALKAYGLGELQAKQYTGTMGAMLKSSGISTNKLVKMSTTIAGLTGDFASFYNLDHEVAFEKIRAGISGEVEPLRQLGINMSVANLEAYAMTRGITKAWKNMSQSEQIMLRYNYLLKVSKDAQGDFAKTYTSAANQQRVFQINMQQLSAKMMAKLLPTINQITIKLNKLFDGDLPNKLTGFMEKAVKTADWMAKNWRVLLPIVEALTVAYVANKTAAFAMATAQTYGLVVAKLTSAWNTASAALALLREGNSLAAVAQTVLNGTMWACPATWIAAAIMGLVVAGYYLIKNWSKVKQFFVGLWNGPLNKRWVQILLYMFAPLIGIPIIIVKNWDKIKKFFIGLWNGPLNKKWVQIVLAAMMPLVGVPILIVKHWDRVKRTFIQLWNGPLNNRYIRIALGVLAPMIGMPIIIIKNWGRVKKAFLQLWNGPLNNKVVQLALAPLAPLVTMPILIIKNWTRVKTFFKGAKNWLNGMSIKQAINTNKFARVPAHARGTNFHPGGLALVGERGPELANLPRGTAVTPANRTEQLLAGLSGGWGGPSISFAPQITIEGNANKDDVKSALDMSQVEFERRMNAYFAKRRRVSFAQ
jgi:hypothetical protein